VSYQVNALQSGDEVIGSARHALINHTKTRPASGRNQWDAMRLSGGTARPNFFGADGL